MPNKATVTSAFLAGIALGAIVQPLSAKDDQPDESTTKPKDETSSDAGDSRPAPIVVTGSRIRGAISASEVVTLDREAIAAAGTVDLGEAVRALPQNFSGGQNPGVGTGAGLANSNLNSTSTANLRGLGADATLTLLNGHRLPSTAAFGGIDISAIPLAAIDRIEVVPDGASAIYGSDAVAGVVNVILRDDFTGVATSGQLGASTEGGYFRQHADVVAGTRWDAGGLLLAYDFTHNSDIAARQRDYAASLDPEASLYPKQQRHAVTLSGHQELASGVTFGLDALYARRESTTVGGTATARYIFRPDVESYTIAPSLEVALGSRWEARVAAVYGRDRTHYPTTFTPQPGAPTITSGCFCHRTTSLELGVEGPLFELAAGSARLALGGGFRNQGLGYSRLINGAASATFDVTRRSRYAYAELYLPLVSTEMKVAAIHTLSLSLAARYEDYSGLDQLATPRIGLVYSPVRDLTLRATWARSFKAPTLYQQFIPYQAYLLPAAAFGAGSGASTVFYTSGGNPDLQAERARSWTLGFDFRPSALAGLTLGATWFDVHYRDRVVQPIAGSIAAAFQDPGYATLIGFDPAAAQLDELIAGAQLGLQNFSGSPYDPANVIALVDNRNVNVAVQAIHGIDARLDWQHTLGDGGSLGFDLAGTWLDSSQQLTSSLPSVDLAGTVFNPPHVRLRASAGLRKAAWRVATSAHFTGALEDRRFAMSSRISPRVTFDLSASYAVLRRRSGAPGLEFTVAVDNLLDDKPQVIRTTGPTDTPYDSTNFSPIGRFVSFGIRSSW